MTIFDREAQKANRSILMKILLILFIPIYNIFKKYFIQELDWTQQKRISKFSQALVIIPNNSSFSIFHINILKKIMKDQRRPHGLAECNHWSRIIKDIFFLFAHIRLPTLLVRFQISMSTCEVLIWNSCTAVPWLLTTNKIRSWNAS